MPLVQSATVLQAPVGLVLALLVGLATVLLALVGLMAVAVVQALRLGLLSRTAATGQAGPIHL